MAAEVDTMARSAAAGACALMADGDEDLARDLLRMYLAEAMPSVGPMVAMQRLVSAMLGVAVAATKGESEPFRQVAGRLMSAGGDW